MANPAPGYAKKPEHRVDLLPETRRVRVTFAGDRDRRQHRGAALRGDRARAGPLYPGEGRAARSDAADRAQDLLPVQGRLLVLDDRGRWPDGGKRPENAVWGYRAPYDEAAGLAGHYAFYKSRVDAIEVS